MNDLLETCLCYLLVHSNDSILTAKGPSFGQICTKDVTVFFLLQMKSSLVTMATAHKESATDITVFPFLK